MDLARERLEILKGGFPDRLYVEIQRHGMAEEQRPSPASCGSPMTWVCRWLPQRGLLCSKDDYEAHDALICIAEGRVLIEEDRRRLTPEHYYKTRAEMAVLFADLPEALASTVEIAQRCSYGR